jgi:hypothetical protein
MTRRGNGWQWHRWLSRLARHPELSDRGFRAAAVLVRFADNETGVCRPPLPQIAAGMGLPVGEANDDEAAAKRELDKAKKAARRALDDLKAVGGVETLEHARQHWATVRRLRWEAVADLPELSAVRDNRVPPGGVPVEEGVEETVEEASREAAGPPEPAGGPPRAPHRPPGGSRNGAGLRVVGGGSGYDEVLERC